LTVTASKSLKAHRAKGDTWRASPSITRCPPCSNAGVYIGHALPLVQQQLLNAGIRVAKIIDENF
jgi:hypothetical protein